MNQKHLSDGNLLIKEPVIRIGNQINVTNKKLSRNDFKTFKQFQLAENKPFEPIRPRVALMRADKQSRINIETKFKAKIKTLQKSPSQIVVNPEQQKKYREDKEEWMLDLQEIYDNIHEELQKLIKHQKQPLQRLNNEQEKKFKELLDRQMIETENMMQRLQQADNKSLQSTREGLLIAKQFRSSLKELYSLMQTVAITQIQKIFASNCEYIGNMRQLRSKQLLKEIRSSTERLEKVRIGNNLDQILQKQKNQYEKLKLTERSKKLQQYLKLKKEYPYDDDIRFDELDYFKNNNEKSIEIQQLLQDFDKAEDQIEKKYEQKQNDDLMELNAKKQDKKVRINNKEADKIQKMNEEIIKQNQLAKTSEQFFSQKNKLEQIIDKINNIDGPHVDFDHKYKHINRYFQERKSLNELYLGDTRLTNFLKQYEEKCKQIDNSRKNVESEMQIKPSSMDSMNLNDIDFNEEIENVSGQNQNIFSPKDKKESTLHKVMKINQEIQQKLMEEEHEEKLIQIKKLGVEQNQNFWDQLLENSNKLNHQKRRNQHNIKSQTSHGQRPRRDLNLPDKQEGIFQKGKIQPQQVTSSKSLGSNFYLTEPLLLQEKERQIWLEKQQRLILNAHPKNPILKLAFSQNKQLQYQQQNNFVTVPVNNLDYLVRREYCKTSEVKKRSSLQDQHQFQQQQQQQFQQQQQQQVLNKNNDENFRNTFFSNFYLFQDNTSTTTPHSFLSNTHYTIRYPTANQKTRTKKWVADP